MKVKEVYGKSVSSAPTEPSVEEAPVLRELTHVIRCAYLEERPQGAALSRRVKEWVGQLSPAATTSPSWAITRLGLFQAIGGPAGIETALMSAPAQDC